MNESDQDYNREGLGDALEAIAEQPRRVEIRTVADYAAKYGTARSPITERGPLQAGFGTSRNWSRMIGGRLYSFHAVLMPDGERRYFASRFDGTDMRFGHQWRPALEWIFKSKEN